MRRARFGDPEVRDSADAVDAHQNVARGHVTVHEPERSTGLVGELMGRVKPPKSVDGDRYDPLGRAMTRVPAQQSIERHALHVVHDEIVAAVLLTHVDRAHHVGMMQTRREPRFVLQHVDELAVLREVGMEPLERVEAREAGRTAHARQVDGCPSRPCRFVPAARSGRRGVAPRTCRGARARASGSRVRPPGSC